MNTVLVGSTLRELFNEVIDMMRERSFQRRGKEMHLRELTDVIALRSTRQEPEQSAATPSVDEQKHRRMRQRDLSKRLRLKSQTLSAIAPEVSLSEVRAFEDAGWVFVLGPRPNNLSEEVAQAKVFIKPEGRLALGTNHLVVQLRGDLHGKQADEVLRPYGCRVVDELNFAPGLFRVEVADPPRGDALDVANELVASGVCAFAEPELIEVVGGR